MNIWKYNDEDAEDQLMYRTVGEFNREVEDYAMKGFLWGVTVGLSIASLLVWLVVKFVL